MDGAGRAPETRGKKVNKKKLFYGRVGGLQQRHYPTYIQRRRRYPLPDSNYCALLDPVKALQLAVKP